MTKKLNYIESPKEKARLDKIYGAEIWDTFKKEDMEVALHHLATAAVYIPDTAIDLLRLFNRQEITLKDISKTVAATLKHCRRYEKL